MSTKAALTRAERQAQARVKLIDVARSMFLEDGYGATSLDRVALEAGFSKGAVYSNFQGKEELCLAVLDEIHAKVVSDVAQAFLGEDSLDAKLNAFSEWARTSLGEPRWTSLLVEFTAVARNNEWVATELLARRDEITSAIATLIRYVTAEAAIAPHIDPDQTATILFSLGIGLGAQRALDASTDVDVFAATIRALIR